MANEAQLRAELHELAQEIAAGLAALETPASQELLCVFMAELFQALAEENRRNALRRRQAEGIAAAKAKGTRFGRPARPLPANFESVYHDWRGGALTLSQAADACGLPQGTFYAAAVRKERAG